MLHGIDGRLVPVQAEPASGQAGGIVILGPDGHSMEAARDRIRAGIVFPVKSSCSRLQPV
jgi:hypothetical protein